MTDYLCISKIPWVETFCKTSLALSKSFKDKRQRKNFINYLKSISLTGSILLVDAGRIDKNAKDYSNSLSHFFNKSNWDSEYLEAKRKEMAFNLLGKCEIVAIDSTALAKRGKCFEKEGAVYDSRINKVTNGFSMLIATAINQNHYSPLKYLMGAKAPFLIKSCKRNIILETREKISTDRLKSGFYPNIGFANKRWENIRCNLLVGTYDKNKKRRIFLSNLSLKRLF